MNYSASVSHSDETNPADVPAGSTRFTGGHLVGSATKLGADLCVAFGRPSFTDADIAATARENGIAAAWQQAFTLHGIKAPSRVRGRFAVLLVQPAVARSFLATDRFATWPMCFAQQGHTLHISDRADTVPLPGRKLSTQALFDYLYHHCIPAPRTVFEGVQRLRAGHVALWEAGSLKVQRYWHPRFDEQRQHDLQAAKAEFLDIVTRGVAHDACGSDTGAFLSGGTDSSTVSGLLCRALGRAADTYSIGFDATGYDEMAYARLAAKHFGTRHHEYYVTPDDLLQGIPKVAVHYDQPFGNSSAVPAWICATRAREDGRERLLAGDGGDELFGGNVRYAKQQVFEIYGQLPGWLRERVAEPLFANDLVRRAPLLKKGSSYIEQARVPLPARTQMYNLLWRLGPDVVLSEGFLRQVNLDGPGAEQAAVWQEADARTQLNRMLAFDWKYTLADNDLPKVVGTTQLAGLDVAFPLLSDELVDFSLTLPDAWKLKGQQLRWFFKEALRGVLPEEIITKKKHGFGLPFGVWACTHGPLKALAADALGSLQARGIVRPAFMRALLDTHLLAHPGYYGEMVWILMTLEFWLREHAPDWAATD